MKAARPLEEARAAHQMLAGAAHARGKIMLIRCSGGGDPPDRLHRHVNPLIDPSGGNLTIL